MRAVRLFLLRAILVVVGAVAALVIGEAAARWLVPSASVSELRGLHEFRPDRGWLYGLRPGAEGRLSETGDALYRINPDGFRGPRHARPKPEGAIRVVVMGDSIAFGYAVEEASAFPRVLEAQLAALVPQAGIEVVNLGVGGYNAWNEAELLKDVGITYQPDLVLVQFCINDLNDPSMHFDAQTRLLLSTIPDAAFPNPSLRRGPRQARSRTLAWCAASRLCALARDRWLAAHATEFDDAAKRAAVTPIGAEDGPEWRWLEARYLEMASAAERAGAGFAVLAFPYPAQLAERGPDPVQEQLLALGRRHGWTVIDPLPAFRTAHAAGTALFADWWHPSASGHRLAAEEVLRVLACTGELGEKARGACPGSGPEGG
jgi:lysophospholipase L1-like esterase